MLVILKLETLQFLGVGFGQSVESMAILSFFTAESLIKNEWEKLKAWDHPKLGDAKHLGLKCSIISHSYFLLFNDEHYESCLESFVATCSHPQIVLSITTSSHRITMLCGRPLQGPSLALHSFVQMKMVGFPLHDPYLPCSC
jgi:hypothetical protein